MLSRLKQGRVWIQAVITEQIGRLTPPTNDKLPNMRKRKMNERITPTRSLLVSLIEMVLQILLPLGRPFTAYGVTLSVRSMVSGIEILCHPKEWYDGPTVGELVYEIMSANSEWTSRVMPSEDGNLATHWVKKENDELYDWNKEGSEPEQVSWKDDPYEDDDDYDDFYDDDESLYDTPNVDVPNTPYNPWDRAEGVNSEPETGAEFEIVEEDDDTVHISFTNVSFKMDDDAEVVSERLRDIRQILGFNKR